MGKGYQYYKKMLAVLGSLSSLFSESATPYLNYRITENLFCKAFSARNVSRTDAAVDAVIGTKGIGIKTFIDLKGRKFEKIAEFNKDSPFLRGLTTEQKIKRISELRNSRLEAAKEIFGVETLVYHCITRKPGKILVYESSMQPIAIDKIKKIKSSDRTIYFEDDKNKYSFNLSKSTLFKEFKPETNYFELPVKIIKEPFELIEKTISEVTGIYYTTPAIKPYVILPLFSVKSGKKVVHPKSALNQWNAGGRKRDLSEVYIQIPIWIHRRFPAFFTNRETSLNLALPNGQIVEAKVCQDNGKALMTKSNKVLGKWLLRQVMNLKEGELLTYEKLEKLGLDSVLVEKIDKNTYSIDFKKIGTYEKFASQYKV